MMDVVAEANASELPRILHKSSRRSSWILVLLVFFGLCAAAACVWTNMETILARSQVLGPAPMHGLSPEVREALLEVRSEQQRASDVIAELNRNIGAQQADLKRMTDQIEALTAKIESLQSSLAAASAPPVSSPPAAQSASKLAKRAVQPSKPEGPISVGGAPLIPEPGSGQH
ncbi:MULTISPECIES: hypothetical protein [Bradyrhizobium]|jgi:uncharacterized coiled-coil protein SlyX|uniref:Blr2122 protein n=2 Tax=Bradyrhizobium TaxID=374 RepID=Q89TB7_BRADU|nr:MULTISPECIES: hypothetical protein [Bradyrhizobium]AND87660.1 hypothetical protein AAV28_07445 [Bradyrhizobium diazoefficiens USDA 110]APO50737.1 hypothetical protein BD122_10775 [Bradyrhizobium diazoefficiens]AWL91266.1 hypothetical protein CIT37_02335 [Bradyrhizobium ottawaense]AWO89183.1 hypothetical protein DI395_12360 [Bradyrhizobium diazoefficiens]KOY05963.1 hypothetical protein AF336_33990 [Bradyrhizobium diazoefficiens]